MKLNFEYQFCIIFHHLSQIKTGVSHTHRPAVFLFQKYTENKVFIVILMIY